MSMNRREFLQVLAVAAAGGMSLQSEMALAEKGAAKMYDLPKFGNVNLLHITDCHAQLLPIYFREPNVNLGFGDQFGKVPHLVGEAFLKQFGLKANTIDAHAFTYLNFDKAAETYGKVGGVEHDAHEEMSRLDIIELLGVENVLAVMSQKRRDRGDDARPVRAGERQDELVIGHGGRGESLGGTIAIVRPALSAGVVLRHSRKGSR